MQENASSMKILRRLLLTAVVLCAAGQDAFSQRPADWRWSDLGSHCVLSVWNLSSLPPAEKDAGRIAQAIIWLDVDVMALIGAPSQEWTQELAAGLEEFGFKGRTLQPPPDSGAERILLVVRKRVNALTPELLPDPPEGTPKPAAVVVRMRIDQFDFRLLIFDLERGNQRENRTSRRRQARFLNKQMAALLKGREQDLLVGGSLNGSKRESLRPFLSANSHVRVLSQGDSEAESTDLLALSQGAEAQLLKGSYYVLDARSDIALIQAPTPGGFRHRPLLAAFRILRDDD